MPDDDLGDLLSTEPVDLEEVDSDVEPPEPTLKWGEAPDEPAEENDPDVDFDSSGEDDTDTPDPDLAPVVQPYDESSD